MVCFIGYCHRAAIWGGDVGISPPWSEKGSKISLKNHKKSSIFINFFACGTYRHRRRHIFFRTCANNGQKFSREPSARTFLCSEKKSEICGHVLPKLYLGQIRLWIFPRSYNILILYCAEEKTLCRRGKSYTFVFPFTQILVAFVKRWKEAFPK